MLKLAVAAGVFLCGCASQNNHIHTEFLSPVCIKPFEGYTYHLCAKVDFEVEGVKYSIPSNFTTDLASIPRVAWPLLSPAHSSIMRASIVHDWFYRMTCDYNRKETDLIFYNMLRNDGVGAFTANTMYYAVRAFGSKYYNEDFCE